MYIFLYLALVWLISFIVSRKTNNNNAFFTGNRKSPWYLVAFGMIGATISGITLMSVPGMVVNNQFTYLQTVFGFFFGYLFVGYVLLPMYYKLQLTSIYSYLATRIGPNARQTGSAFFILSKLISTSSKLYIAIVVLQTFTFNFYSIPFWLTTTGAIFFIWLYTYRSGIQSLVWTDTLQTLLLITAISILCYQAFIWMDQPTIETLKTIYHSHHSTIFVWNDWHSSQHFLKAFISGIFIVIVMTGLDQDMMQKNLTCKTAKGARRNMLCYGFMFIPINLVLLILGAIFILYAQKEGIFLPQSPDRILPFFAVNFMNEWVKAAFVIGIVSASFSSTDSALTSITTSFAVDFLKIDKKAPHKAEKTRKWTHIIVCFLFIFIVLLFKQLQNQSILDLIYKIVGYCYGPLLGLFSFGLLTSRITKDKWTPYICILSPILCYLLQALIIHYTSYKFGYELLMLNGMITFALLFLFSKKRPEIT